MKTLDCVILAYEGPILRAYLSVFRELGFRAKCIVKFYDGHNKLHWIPKFLRNSLLFNQESLRNNYWPIHFLKDKQLSNNVTEELIKRYNLGANFFDLFGKVCLDSSLFAESCVYFDWVEDGWRNKKLLELLQSFGPQTYLFTGGGLVPKNILELPNTSFIHIHPGFLPYTRGADGISWSTLTRGKPGAACFYMVPKLDEGHLISTEEFEGLHFQKPKSADTQTLYRLIYSFYNPAIRALCLRHVLEKFGTLKDLPTTEQEISKGITFHFMHDLLKQKVLNNIFV